MEPQTWHAIVDAVIHAHPCQSWRTFLANHAQVIWAADLFVAQTLTFQTLYVIFFIGNPSSHLQRLEQGGMLEIERRFLGKVPNTQVSLTVAGRRTIDKHWKQLDAIRRWRPAD